MKRVLQSLLFASIIARVTAAEEPPSAIKAQIPELHSSAQVILVIAESWTPGPAKLRRFERQVADWAPVGEEIRAVIGRSGLAWGIGLHGSHPAGGSGKREGDGKSPAGVFTLEEVFGSISPEEAAITRFPYRQVRESFAGVDDPSSRYYNRIVDSAAVVKDWHSAETMVRADGLYRLGCVVRHNWRPFPGYGSCIFIHTWQGENVGTSGCTAMATTDLESVLRWIDERKRPLLVQLPAAEYAQRKSAWKLP